MGFIHGVGFYRVTFAHKYAVATAGTASHDPVDLNHACAIGRLSYYNATTGIGGVFQAIRVGIYGHFAVTPSSGNRTNRA